jgi:hypothetical protein
VTENAISVSGVATHRMEVPHVMCGISWLQPEAAGRIVYQYCSYFLAMKLAHANLYPVFVISKCKGRIYSQLTGRINYRIDKRNAK